jgi:hypothetical protein
VRTRVILKSFRFLILSVCVLQVFSSCSHRTFYAKTYKFNESVATGNLDKAEKLLSDNKKFEEGKDRFLYYVNAGVMEHLKGDLVKSNEYFQKADIFIEDFRKKAVEQGAGFLLNPNLTTYSGEDHEVLLINYYKALNYYQLGDKNAALVEVRRLNLRLNQLSEKYKSEKKYQRDAFMHLLMGLIYESNMEYNNAFIAYRNAFDIYESDYAGLFGMGAPEQLKYDLVRSAALGGLPEEKRIYEKQFGIQYNGEEGEANFVLLWNNGLGPVKDEWGLNFAIIYTGGGWVTFVNEEYGMSFPFYVGDQNLQGLTWIKVVFPKYVERLQMFQSATLQYGGNVYPLEIAEDLNAISFHVLNERMLLEFATSLIRVALKQAAAHEIGKANDSPELGAVLSVVASATESADTRNWQTVPHSIYYKRVPVNAGEQSIEFNMYGDGVTTETHRIDFNIRKGETLIYPFYSLGAYPPVMKHMPQ